MTRDLKGKLVCSLFAFIYSESVWAETTYSAQYLKQNPVVMEYILLDMLEMNEIDSVQALLPLYQSSVQPRENLIALSETKIMQYEFENFRNKEAKQSLLNLQSKFANERDRVIIQKYLEVLKQRESWQFQFGANYVYNKNVNSAATVREIENTGFTKSDQMMPQSAKGISYYFNAEKNWNLSGSHNLHFSNEISGKWYWDNHDYDELNNRTYLGYAYQNARFRWALKPFYERQWADDHRYSWANGVRMEYRQPFAKKWQFSTVWEFSQPRYFNRQERNGTVKLASATLVYQHSPKGYLYLGTDFIREQTRERQYSNDLKSLRAGWKQTWGYEISTQLNGSMSLRQYKDFASLGGILPLNTIRRDKIYTANLTLWKNNWHWYGFTPKLQLRWKRQNSNIPSMFSYSEKYTQMLIEKDF